jgi:protein tyrosine kinase modulator
MTLQLFLSALRARLALFATVVAAAVLTALLVSLLLPKSYKATALVLADANKDEQSLSTVLVPPRERIGYMQTQMDILGSDRVARKVARDLKLAESAEMRRAFVEETDGRGSIEDWLVERLLKRMKLETSQSNVIQVSYSSADAAFAAATANAFAQAYIDTTLELRVEPTRQAAVWFGEQLKTLRANLEGAQAALTEYHRSQGIISADERLDVENTRLGELSSQLVKTQEHAADLEARERQARAELKRGISPDRLPDVLASPQIQKLNADLAAGEAKLREMQTQYGANYPLVQRQVSENQSLRERLDAEMAKVVAGVSNARRQMRQREAETARSLAAQRARLLELKESRNELAVLTRNVETAQRTYDTAMQRSVVNQVESRASQANVVLLNAAVVPGRPSHPRTLLNTALAGLIGTLLGIGCVILLELLDRRVRSAGDLERGLGLKLPVLAALERWQPLPAPGAGQALPAP